MPRRQQRYIPAGFISSGTYPSAPVGCGGSDSGAWTLDGSTATVRWAVVLPTRRSGTRCSGRRRRRGPRPSASTVRAAVGRRISSRSRVVLEFCGRPWARVGEKGSRPNGKRRNGTSDRARPGHRRRAGCGRHRVVRNAGRPWRERWRRAEAQRPAVATGTGRRGLSLSVQLAVGRHHQWLIHVRLRRRVFKPHRRFVTVEIIARAAPSGRKTP